MKAAISIGPSRRTAKRFRPIPTTPTTRSRCSAPCSRPRGRISTGAGVRAEGPARSGARRIQAGAEYDPTQPAGQRRKSPTLEQHDSRARGGLASAACDPAAARTRAGRVDAAPILNLTTPRAAASVQQRQPARHPGAHRQRDGHQHDVRPRVPGSAVTVQLDGVTLEQALSQILSVNQLSYKVLSERSILVFADTAQKHAQYDDQVIQTFYLSQRRRHRTGAVAQHGHSVRRASRCSRRSRRTRRRTRSRSAPRRRWSQIFEKIIQQNDKPRAEIVVDIEIMEVNRSA